jgi:integrase
MGLAKNKESIQRTNYTLKYPDFKGRATFALLKVNRLKDGSREFETVENDRLKSINEEWIASKQTETKRDELLKLVKEIRASLHHSQKIIDGKTRIIKNIDNQKILDDFISEKIEDRKLVCPTSQIHDFRRAVLAIDFANLSLKTASRKELQKALDRIDENNKHRRVCSRLNSLLRFIGRNDRLEPMEYVDTPFIFTEEELLNIAENIVAPTGYEDHLDDIKNLFYCLYYTGLRVGEAFALYSRRHNDSKTGRKMNFLSANLISVSSQMKKNTLLITRPKNKKERMAYVIQNNPERVKAWADLDRTTKEKLRDIEFSRVINRAAAITYPKNSEMRRIRAHDCRHSYAVYLLNRGISISLIAKALGNSVQVCEKYYLPYALQEEGIQMIHMALSK